MNPLRHLLLALALVFAQLAAGAHAVEHGAGKEGGLPGHACELCLAVHDLGSALPSLAALPLVAVAPVAPVVAIPAERGHLSRPLPRQGAPPLA